MFEGIFEFGDFGKFGIWGNFGKFAWGSRRTGYGGTAGGDILSAAFRKSSKNPMKLRLVRENREIMEHHGFGIANKVF